MKSPSRDTRDKMDDELTGDAERARFRVEVTRQRVRLSKEQLQRARTLYKEAKKEAKRARKQAAAARKRWKSTRKRVGRATAKAVKRKTRRSAVLRRAALRAARGKHKRRPTRR